MPSLISLIAAAMPGRPGDDVYLVKHPHTLVIELPDHGHDTIHTRLDRYALPANVEKLVLLEGPDAANAVRADLPDHAGWAITALGNQGDNHLIGNSAPNRLNGGGGNDVLDGGAGADFLIGGRGDDTYLVDDVGDQAMEVWDGDIDTVIASVSFTLGDRVENLILTGTGRLDGTGNGQANVIVGNDAGNKLAGKEGDDRLIGGAGHDQLDGGEGRDVMIGGAGGDAYVCDDSGDVVIEAAGEGLDTVWASADYTLPEHVENLVMAGRARALVGIGNAQGNLLVASNAGSTLAGLGGNDILNGGAGADVLLGGEGEDWIQDSAGGGALYGGAGNDVVSAGGHRALMAGGRGDDFLFLGTGPAVVAFNRGDGGDVLYSDDGSRAVLSLGGGIGIKDVSLLRAGDNLVVDLGSGDHIALAHWYGKPARQSLQALQFLPGEEGDGAGQGAQLLDFSTLVQAFDAAQQALGAQYRLDQLWPMPDYPPAPVGPPGAVQVQGGALARRYAQFGDPDAAVQLDAARLIGQAVFDYVSPLRANLAAGTGIMAPAQW